MGTAPLRLQLELERASDPIEGRLHCDGKTVPFCGWLELIAVLEAADTEGAGPPPHERRPDSAPGRMI